MILDKKLIGLAKIASRDYSRPVLTAVRLADGKATATDGFRLLQIDLPQLTDGEELPPVANNPVITEEGESHLLSGKEFEKALSLIPAKLSITSLRYAWTSKGGQEKSVKVVSANITTINAPEMLEVEGNYPKIEGVLPTDAPKAKVTVDVKYLISLLEAISKTGVEHVTLETYEELKPLKLTAQFIDGSKKIEEADGEFHFDQIIRKITGLLMPVRI